MGIKIEHGLHSAEQVSKIMTSTRIMTRSLIKQTLDQGEVIDDIDKRFEHYRAKNDRQIARLKDEVLHQKVCSGILILTLFVEILGNVLGAW